tara:strand:+ start:49 stop:1092 length:1044 start_codon:yes stop_codon:yes gene_type:complete
MADERYDSMMQVRMMGIVLSAIMLLALSPTTPVEAQEVPTPVGWEMGLVYSDGASEDDPFQLEEGETSIRFWVRNDNLAGDIHVALGYDSSSDARLEGETHTTVGSGSNDTFTLKFIKPSSGLFDLWSIPAGTVYDFEIYGELTSVGPVPAGTVPAGIRPSQTIDGEVIVPKLYRWDVEIIEIEHSINAGTEFNLHVDLKNMGNTADSFTSASIEDDCPVLSVDDEPLQSMEGVVKQALGVTNVISVKLVFDASSTHPTRKCEIEIQIKSTGVIDGGQGDSSNKDETDVQVEARPVGAQQDQDDASVGNDDGPENQEQVTSDNFLMFPSLVTPMAIIWAALTRTREE